jgi:hypothetical protein
MALVIRKVRSSDIVKAPIEKDYDA